MIAAIVILLLVLAMVSYREDKLQMLGIFSFSERKRASPPSTEISVLAFVEKKVQCFPGCLFFGNMRHLFYQPMDEKIKTWPHFPAKENPNMRKTLFDWPIVLQYDVKSKYRLISRKFSGMKAFHPSV